MDATFRPLTPDDEPLLWRALYHAVWVPPGAAPARPDVVRRPDLARYVAGWMRRPGDAGLAADVGGAAVGAGWLRRWTPDEHGYGFVDAATPELSMALFPGHRGRGVGTALLDRMLTAAGDAPVSLSVSLENPARRLYERAGFRPVGEPAGGAVVMVRRPAPPAR